MTLLYRNLRIHQIFGANTDVGKTIFATALVRASAYRGHNVLYLKPVSTGDVGDADDLYECRVTYFAPSPKMLITSWNRHVRRFSGSFSDRVVVDCLFRYNEPVSPHLAVLRQGGAEQVFIPSSTFQGEADTPSAGLRWYSGQRDNRSRVIIYQGGFRRRSRLHRDSRG